MANYNNAYHCILLAARKLHGKIYSHSLPTLVRIKDPNKVSDIISAGIQSDKPFMISRFGAVEISAVNNYLGIKNKEHNLWKLISGKQPEWWWNEGVRYCMKNNAGFFPNDDINLSKFCELILSDLKHIDVLASWQEFEYNLKDELSNTIPIDFIFLDPFWSDIPWTKYLEGKKVLVIHPFTDEIKYQYENNRTELHCNHDILPQFKLKVLKSIQSIGGNSEFNSWFEALDFMKKQIDSIDFDICLLGCGAYGMPLAAHIKRIGKKAIHVGGSLQLLFGIKGKRWETDKYAANYFKDGVGKYPMLINEKWIRPFETSKFKGAENVENGCYW